MTLTARVPSAPNPPTWHDVSLVTRVATWDSATFGRHPRRDPWPRLGRRHRAVIRIERDLQEAIAVAIDLCEAAEGLWCDVMRAEVQRAAQAFLLLAQGASESGPSAIAAYQDLRKLVELSDAVLGCVGILDDFEALQIARDQAALLMERLGEEAKRRIYADWRSAS